MQVSRSPDLARTIFQFLALGGLIAASFWILQPFLIALVWAGTVAISTWPLLLRTQWLLGGKRAPAVAVMTLVLLLILVAPIYFAVGTIVKNAGQMVEWSNWLAKHSVPGPPAWLVNIPVIGLTVATRWQRVASASPSEISAYLSPFAHTAALWFLSRVGNLGQLLAQLVLTIVITAILYANGETAGRGAELFARRIAGPEGTKAVFLAANAVRGVAMGIVVTALLQSVLAGLGIAIAGVPFAPLLTALMFILAVAQIGPAPVLIAAVIWVYFRSGVLWGTGLLIWSIFCATFDNFLRPVLIRRGANLPLLLIFAGVLGGLIAFGVIGLFIGPVVLAVAYTLLVDWVGEPQATPQDHVGDVASATITPPVSAD
jgi:predicted PurR-regulated permease PerM